MLPCAETLQLPCRLWCQESKDLPVCPQVRLAVHQDAVGGAVRHEGLQNLTKAEKGAAIGVLVGESQKAG